MKNFVIMALISIILVIIYLQKQDHVPNPLLGVFSIRDHTSQELVYDIFVADLLGDSLICEGKKPFWFPRRYIDSILYLHHKDTGEFLIGEDTYLLVQEKNIFIDPQKNIDTLTRYTLSYRHYFDEFGYYSNNYGTILITYREGSRDVMLEKIINEKDIIDLVPEIRFINDSLRRSRSAQ